MRSAWLCGFAVAMATIDCKGKPDDAKPAAAAPAAPASPASPASIDAAPDLIDAIRPQDNHELALQLCPKVVAPYLFRVEKHEHASFLLGTRHLGVGLDRMPTVVADDLAHAKLAVFEVAPDDNPAEDDKPPAQALSDVLGPDLWKHFRELVGDDAANAVEHEKPSTAIILMSVAFEDLGASLDQQLQDLAKSSHVATRGLEAAHFQDTVIDQLLDARMLRAAIGATKTRDELRQETVDDLGSYCKGARMDRDPRDENDMRKAGFSDAEIAHYDDVLLFGRNRAWVPQLEKIFADGDAFVAVGADHLLGPGGLLEALQKDGFQITRVVP